MTTHTRYVAATGLSPRVRRHGRRLILGAAIVGAMAIAPAANADTGGKTCFGKKLTIKGTLHRDVIHGTPHNDVIDTYSGNDVIYGGGGNDLICSGSGNDVIVGGAGEDKLDGYRGQDLLVGDYLNSGQTGKWHDTLVAAAGNDLIVGDVYNPNGGDATGTGNNHIQSGPGNDHAIGNAYTTDGTATGTGDDVIFGGRGRDVVVGDAKAPHQATGTGNDFERLDERNDLGVGDAMITGSGLASGGGNDSMTGYTGDDVLIGGSYAPNGDASGGGRDYVFGGKSGDDILIGDSLAGGSVSGGGRDHLDGSKGDDLLVDDGLSLAQGGSESGDGQGDLVAGGKDNDRFLVSGDDRCIGGKGTDTDLSKPVCMHPSGIDAHDPGAWPAKMLQTTLGPFLP